LRLSCESELAWTTEEPGLGQRALAVAPKAEQSPPSVRAVIALMTSTIQLSRNFQLKTCLSDISYMEEETMNGLIYLVGLIVVIMAILSLFGLR
jgi:hypothetical protein